MVPINKIYFCVSNKQKQLPRCILHKSCSGKFRIGTPLWKSYFNKATACRPVTLTLYRLMFPSYRNQSVDLQCKSTDWFLYDGNIGR